MSNLIAIFSLEAELFYEDGQTDRDMTKLMVALRNFANAPNNVYL